MDNTSAGTEKPPSQEIIETEGAGAMIKIIGVLLVFVLLGVLTGLVGATLRGKTTPTVGEKGMEGEKQTEGIKDKKVFKDNATGILQEGGFEGEGSFHLERSGGESQNVYLTSSVVDLSSYIGKKVTVWGETFEAEKAGWLMDVGLVEISK